MTKQFDTILKEQFIDQITRKFQAYALVDIGNKINKLIRTEVRDESYDERVDRLINERSYYERASKDQLLNDLIESVMERFYEEDMDNIKAVFDLMLSKRQFSSFHETF